MSTTLSRGIAPTPSNAVLHVYDLPQLHSKPSASALLGALRILERSSTNFDNISAASPDEVEDDRVHPSQVPRYLTNIVSSSLNWLNPDEAEAVWDAASLRLSERAGRSAAPSLDRCFRINDSLSINLHEPSLTEDNLGLKTWTSSLLLSRRLPLLAKHLPPGRSRMLELGSGTGLVGLAAAVIWRSHVSEVLLTDLPAIVPNLQRNIIANIAADEESVDVFSRVTVNCRVLDWADHSNHAQEDNAFPLIVAADPIYSSEHPELLANTVRKWLQSSGESRFIVELPIRDGYSNDRADLRERLNDFMQIIEEGTESGYDDWEDADGRPSEVTCWWAVWGMRLRDIG